MTQHQSTLFTNTSEDKKSAAQVIFGNVPAKSNCYRIITFKKKNDNSVVNEMQVDILHKMLKAVSIDQVRFLMKEFGELDSQNGHYSLAKTKQLKKYEEDFVIQAMKVKNKKVDVPFELLIDVYFPTKRSDLDNSLKVVLDCLQACEAIVNDSLCMRMIPQKFIDKENPRVEFVIRPLTDTLKSQFT